MCRDKAVHQNKQKVIGVQILEKESWGGERMAFLKGQIIELAVRSVTSVNLHCVERSDKLTYI